MDQYSSIKKRTEYGYEEDMHFIKIHLGANDKWVNQSIMQLGLPRGIIVAAIKRGEEVIIPRGNVVLKEEDTVVLGAEPFDEKERIKLKEIVLQKQNPWTGARIRDLDISRHSVIVLVKRNGKAMIPNGNLVLKEGDNVFLYTQLHLSSANDIEI